jgi:hypothetical protein
MAYALSTTTGKVGPTVLGGTYRIVTARITPDAATGSYIFSDFGTVDMVLGYGYCADLTSNCYTMQAAIDGSVANKVNFKLWKAGGTAADTAFVDFYVSVLAH